MVSFPSCHKPGLVIVDDKQMTRGSFSTPGNMQGDGPDIKYDSSILKRQYAY